MAYFSAIDVFPALVSIERTLLLLYTTVFIYSII